MKLNKKQTSALEKLETLFEQEHGGCDDPTCSMSVAFQHGYTVHAIDCFAGSGAASDEFYETLKKIPRTLISKQSQVEAGELCKEIEHVECPHCNAITWDPQWCTSNSKVYCYSCAKDFKAGAK